MTRKDEQMELGMIGLGRMGLNMAERLIRAGHRVVGTARTEETVREAEKHGVEGASTVEELIAKLTTPRHVWMMVPAGQVTEAVLESLLEVLEKGDTIIEGGNSNYRDTVRRAKKVDEAGLHYLDAGTSGGIWGLENGYSLMVGGSPEAYQRAGPIFQTLSPGDGRGLGHVGPSGAGHFVKMVHNGIEYGMMQALAEGFAILEAKKEFDLDLEQCGRVWQYGSVVRSWLLDLAVAAFAEDPRLERLEGYVEDSGEGRWTVLEAIDLDVPAPIITLSLQNRFRSRIGDDFFGDRLLAALRKQFGGHPVRKAE
ncbi:MAG: phosphogluconate dehydrogenase (NAD(+)-dependent, decarboxylating) [Longimicrobiales bacterium]